MVPVLREACFEKPLDFLVQKTTLKLELTTSLPLKMVGVPSLECPRFQGSIFRGENVSFREGRIFFRSVFVTIFHHQLGHLFVSVYTPEI